MGYAGFRFGKDNPKNKISLKFHLENIKCIKMGLGHNIYKYILFKVYNCFKYIIYNEKDF